MTIKICPSCNGTGKQVESIFPNGSAVLKGCTACGGGVLPGKRPKKKSALPAQGTGVGEVFRGVGSQVVDSFVDAGKTKIATATMHKLLEVSKETIKSFGYELPEGAPTDTVLQLGVPLLIILGTSLLGAQAESIIPRALLDNVNAAAGYALKGVSKEKMDVVAEKALPFLLQVGQIGMFALNAGSGQTQLTQGNVDEEEAAS